MRSTDIAVPTDPAHRREWIKYRLRLAGYSFGTLARELGMSRSAVRNAIWGPYPRMESIIAARIGLKPHELWPERYTAEGLPNRRMGRPPKSAHAHNVITVPTRIRNGKHRRAS